MSKVTDVNNDETVKEPKRKEFEVKTAKAVIPVIVDGKPTGKDQFGSAVNDKGQLIAVPKTILNDDGTVSYQGFDIDIHKTIPKALFADAVTFLEYQAEQARQRGNKLLGLADERNQRAAKIRKFGDTKLARTAAKLQKMQAALAAMKAQLEMEGIDVEAILE